MKFIPFAFLLVLVLFAPAADAEIYRCINETTGEAEFRETPCNSGEIEDAVPESVLEQTDVLERNEAAAIEVIIEETRNEFEKSCEAHLDHESMTHWDYRRRCNAALRNLAECDIAASRMLPLPVHADYVGAMAAGMTEQEANEFASSSENWSYMNSAEARRIAAPAEKFVKDCSSRIFDELPGHTR